MTNFERKAATIELAILAVTLIITSVLGSAVYYQTRSISTLQRTTYMIERFNQSELVDAREVVDRWLSTKEAPKALLDRASYADDQELDSRKPRQKREYWKSQGAMQKRSSKTFEYSVTSFRNLALR